jgi:predicted nucleotidyltransferase
MNASHPFSLPTLPPQVRQILDESLQAARTAFGDQLRSVILFGSAAEGKLHPTSDVNLLLVLTAFEQAQADQLRPSFRLGQAIIQLRPMLLPGSTSSRPVPNGSWR